MPFQERTLNVDAVEHECTVQGQDEGQIEVAYFDLGFYSSMSNLIREGVREISARCVSISSEFGISGWDQHGQLLQRIESVANTVSRVSARKGPRYQDRMQGEYQNLLSQAHKILGRASLLLDQMDDRPADNGRLEKLADLATLTKMMEQVCSPAHYCVIESGSVLKSEEIINIFETHARHNRTQTATNPFCRLVLVYEDAAVLCSLQSVSAAACIAKNCA
jgi:hypothetical protein